MDFLASATLACVAHVQPAIVLYIGPDVFLPLTSALAVVVGAALMFWQKVVSLAQAIWRSIFKPKP